MTKLSVIEILTVMLFLIIATSVNAQSATREILIGEKVPDVPIKHIVNYRSANSNLSEFKGKLLILDFWATYCAPCVGMFPRTDSLEKIFKDKIKFLAITKESKEKVTEFMNHMYTIRHIKPVSVVEDDVFGDLFIYNSIPYYVWIDAAGKVLASTGAEEINKKNIEAVLAGKPASFENRKDVRKLNIDIVHSPLFLLNDNFVDDPLSRRSNVSAADIISYSIATKYIDNASGQLMFDSTRFAAYNVSIDFLYRWFYDVGYYDNPVFHAFDPPSNYRFDIHDKVKLAAITVPKELKAKPGTKEMLDWAKKNAVAYEIMFPKGIPWKEKMKLVKEDLDRNFANRIGFQTHVETIIDSNTAVLHVFNKTLVPVSAGGKPNEHDDRYAYSQLAMPLSRFIGVLNGPYFRTQKITFIDKTGVAANVDIKFNCDMTNLAEINEALKKYGLVFKIEPTPVDILIFSATSH